MQLQSGVVFTNKTDENSICSSSEHSGSGSCRAWPDYAVMSAGGGTQPTFVSCNETSHLLSAF